MEQPITTIKQNRRRNILAASAIFILCAVLYTLYWATVLRYEENTDDAYVAGHRIQLTPEVSGTVIKVMGDETDRVEAGQVVVMLDVSDAKLDFDRARQNFVQALRETQQLISQTQQYAAQIKERKTQLNQTEVDLARRMRLAGTAAISPEELQHAQDAVISAKAALEASVQQHKTTTDLLGADTQIMHQPKVQAAATSLEAAWLTLKRTQVKAPVAGYIARRAVQIGQYVEPGTPLMAIVPLEQVWVEANFKESQLKNIRIGQTATLTADVYGSKVVYHGKVLGLSAGTGSAFSLLPAQNATGNWIKIVQRLPVRIALDLAELKKHPLRLGLSMDVILSTRDKSGSLLATAPNTGSMQQTTVLTPNLKEAEALIMQLVQQELGKGG